MPQPPAWGFFLQLAEHDMFLKQLILAAFRVLHDAARPLFKVRNREQKLRPCGRDTASESNARFSHGIESFEVMAARAASGA
jgi:hypothetical protein